MIKHIVMWKLVDSFDGKNKMEIAKNIKENLEALKDVIPQIKEIEIGINFNKSDSAYDISLYSVFKSEEDLIIYQNHPEHLRIAAFIGKVKTDRVVCDYNMVKRTI